MQGSDHKLAFAAQDVGRVVAAGTRAASFDHLVGAREQWNVAEQENSDA